MISVEFPEARIYEEALNTLLYEGNGQDWEKKRRITFLDCVWQPKNRKSLKHPGFEKFTLVGS